MTTRPTRIKIGNEYRMAYRIGLRMYIFPPDPPVGDFKALQDWKPKKESLYRSLKLILELKGIIKTTTKMDEIEELLHKARLLATDKGYPFFCSCTDLETGRSCISIGHKDKDAILKMLTAACVQEPEVNAIIRGTFVATTARMARNRIIANRTKNSGKAN